MSNIDEIKNEIRVRRVKSTCINDVKEPSSRKHKIIYNLLMCFMLLLSMFFDLAIYAKKDEEASFLNEKLGLSINFSAFNHVISKNMNKVIDFRIFSNLFNYGTNPVSGVSDYLFLGDDLYSNSSNAVKNIADGVVSYINEDESG